MMNLYSLPCMENLRIVVKVQWNLADISQQSWKWQQSQVKGQKRAISKGRTTKALKDVAEKLSKDNADIFPMGVKDGIVKKRFEGAIELITKFQGSVCIMTGYDDEPMTLFH